MKTIDFEEITLRFKSSSRGGGIEIDLSSIAKKYQRQKMTAYQNYLGGGLLGSIQNDCTIKDWRENANLCRIASQLSKYYFDMTNDEEDEFNNDFENLQLRSESAY